MKNTMSIASNFLQHDTMQEHIDGGPREKRHDETFCNLEDVTRASKWQQIAIINKDRFNLTEQWIALKTVLKLE
jgi:hypothetical protein